MRNRRRLSGGWNARAGRPRPSITPGTLLALLLALGVGWGVWHNRQRAKGRGDLPLGVAQAVTQPAQAAATRTDQGSRSLFRSLFRGSELEKENQALRTQVDQLLLENERLRDQEVQNANLRALLGFVQNHKPAPLVAEVTAWLPTPFEQSILIGRGSRQGVREGMPVRTAAGLVGKVVEVSPFSARIRLLTDPDSGVGAVVPRAQKPFYGVVVGVEEVGPQRLRRYPLELIHIEKEADLKPGEVVRTSGHGGVFPPGIPIGVIESVREDSTHLLKIARLRPLAPQPGDLREVLLLSPQTSAQASSPTRSTDVAEVPSR